MCILQNQTPCIFLPQFMFSLPNSDQTNGDHLQNLAGVSGIPCFFKCVMLSCLDRAEWQPLDDTLRDKDPLSLLCHILYVKSFLMAKGSFRGSMPGRYPLQSNDFYAPSLNSAYNVEVWKNLNFSRCKVLPVQQWRPYQLLEVQSRSNCVHS